jgi:L-lactate dehydrogenase complex protein LldE
MRIALFMPCFNDALFPGTGIATVRILEGLGHVVEFPGDQTCCGQIHFNTGFRREARRLMGRFLSVFGGAEVVVAPSASCVAMVREQYPELARGWGEPGLVQEIDALAGRTFELSEFLVGVLGVEELGASFPQPVTFHPTCHSIRSIHIGDAPLRLLRAVDGLELLPLPKAEECCGFGGTFAAKNPDTSLAMMEDKIRSVRESGARVLTAVDNSCLMHLAGGMRRMGLLEVGDGKRGGGPSSGVGIRVMHLAEILVCGKGVAGG